MPFDVADKSDVGEMSEIPDQTELRRLGYHYDSKGELRSTSTNNRFQFVDQEHYERLGRAVERYIREAMQAPPHNLKAAPIPKLADPQKDPHCLVYMSENALTSDSLFLVIQGTHPVRPGQWARALCINESLKTGTIFSYLDEIRRRKSGVIVFNPNENEYSKEGPKPWKIKIPGSGSPEEHAISVYDSYVKVAKATSIHIVAHSYGGISTMHLLEHRPEIMDILKSVIFTDSIHGKRPFKEDDPPPHRWQILSLFGLGSCLPPPPPPLNARIDPVKVLKEKGVHMVNFVKSNKPVGEDLGSDLRGVPKVSAGHHKHEWTSHAAKEAAWDFIDTRHAWEFIDT